MIKTEHLTHIYGAGTPFETKAIDDVSLHIPAGDFVGVIGHTGSGKSTLIAHFNAILKPTSGRIFIDGNDLWDSDKQVRLQTRFDVGLVFQYPEYQLFEETVYKDIAFGPKNMGLPEDEVAKRVEKAIEFVGLDSSLLEKSPFDLSGGQKRRVAIAGVMALEPKVLVLDEPAAGLDPKGRDEILGRIRDYHRETKSTILLVSHSMEDISRNAKTALVMNHGKLAMHTSVEEVFERAEELTRMGLDIPAVTKVFISLQQKGYPVSKNIYTVEQGKAELMRLIGKGGETDA